MAGKKKVVSSEPLDQIEEAYTRAIFENLSSDPDNPVDSIEWDNGHTVEYVDEEEYERRR